MSNVGLPSVASTGGDDQRLMRFRTLTRGRGIPLQHNRTEKLSSPRMMITMLTKKVPRRSESNRPSSSDLLIGRLRIIDRKTCTRPCDFSSTAAWPSHGVIFSKTSKTNQKNEQRLVLCANFGIATSSVRSIESLRDAWNPGIPVACQPVEVKHCQNW